MNPRRTAWKLALACVCLASAACTTVPETGRTQFNLMSPEEEMRLGFTSFQQLKQNTPLSRDAAAADAVRRVGERIAAVAPLPGAQWEFVLFEDPQPNAFCLPGGKVGVFSGMLPIAWNEAGLATVIGHEVAHAVARHGGERMSRAMALEMGGQLLGVATAGSPWQGAMVSVYGLGAQLGVALPHSRDQEGEADFIGLLYMARAGYDPAEAIAFWRRFADYNRKQGGGAPWFLQTHPLDEQRIAALERALPKARAEYVPRR